MSTRVAISIQWEQFNSDIDKLGARALNLLKGGCVLFVIGAIAATSGFFIIIVIATGLLAWGISMRRRVYRLRDIAALHQDQGVFPDSTGELSEAELNSHDHLYSAPKARENPISGFGSSDPVNNKRTEYSKEWIQLETEINEFTQRANWIFKTTNITHLTIIGLSIIAFIRPDIMLSLFYAPLPVLFGVMYIVLIFMGMFIWPVYLIMQEFVNDILPYNHGMFFIDVYLVYNMAKMAISSLTHSPSTAIVTSVIIAIIVAYCLFGQYLDRRAKLLHRRLNPPLRDRSRVVPISDSACVITKRERSEIAGFTKSRRVIGEHVSHPLVGWRTCDQDGWGLRSNLTCRGNFEDFRARCKGNLYSKIATPCRRHGKLHCH